MKWIPPRSIADRWKWSQEHPWIAGCYFGLLFALLSMVWGIIWTRASISFALVVASAVWVVTWVLLPVLVRRRVGERPDADSYPPPTLRRLWTRASDRFLFVFMVIGIAGALSSVPEVVARPHDLPGALLTLVASAFLISTTWAERRRRGRRGTFGDERDQADRQGDG